MASNGPVPIQGCALRLSRLNADGTILAASQSGMIQDDKPFMKWTAKPAMEAGTEVVPKSACGQPLIAYKDYDRIKRWAVTLDLGDLDPEKQEMLGGGSLLTLPTNAGRTITDGVLTLNSTTLTSATAAFTGADYGRSVTAAGQVPAGTYIQTIVNATTVLLSQAATASGSAVSVTLGALTGETIGLQASQLLTVPSPNGVAVEIWQKLMVRGTGFQGSAPRPTFGSQLLAPAEQNSAWARWGWFRCYLFPGDIGIEDKETPMLFTGWAIENPGFGTGPAKDWTTTGLPGGPPVNTTRTYNVMADIALPTPLQPGYQTTAA